MIGLPRHRPRCLIQLLAVAAVGAPAVSAAQSRPASSSQPSERGDRFPTVEEDTRRCSSLGGQWKKEGNAHGCRIGRRREGRWRSVPGAGQLRWVRTYRRGVLDGPVRAYYGNCVRAYEGHYAADKRHGAWVEYHKNGVKAAEGRYVRGERSGTWRFYHEEGPRVREGPYVHDRAHGLFTEWFTNGQLWHRVRFVDDERQIEQAKACRQRRGRWVQDYEQRQQGCRVGRNREGPWAGWHENGKRSWDVSYKSGERHGELVEHHPTGQLLRRGQYVFGVPSGTHVFRAADGRVYGSSTIIDGSGRWRSFHHNGKPRLVGRYEGHRREGLWLDHYENGVVKEKVIYRAGNAEGRYFAYYKTGEPALEGSFKEGWRSGSWKALYSNGQQVWAGRYERGARTGKWTNWYYTGEKKSEGPYVDDAKHGDWVEHFPNGKRRAAGPYRLGKRHGEWSQWWQSGQFWRKVTYRMGQEISIERLACLADGGSPLVDAVKRLLGCHQCAPKPKGGIDFKRVGLWSWWHANGKRERRGHYREGDQHGRWTIWYDNGGKMLEGAYQRAKEQGRWTGFFRDGSRRFVGSYADGKQVGTWTTFHRGGQRASEGRYEGGARRGQWTFWHPNGQLKDRGAFDDQGREQGTWTSWHPNGKKRSEGRFVDGKREGRWTWWRLDGTVWLERAYRGGKEVR